MVTTTLERILMAGLLAITAYAGSVRLSPSQKDSPEHFAQEYLQLCPDHLSPGETLYGRVQKALDDAGFPASFMSDAGKAYRGIPLSPQDYSMALARFNHVDPRRIPPTKQLYLPQPISPEGVNTGCLPGDVVYEHH